MKKRQFSAIALVAALCASALAPALAQQYPDRPVKVILPFGAGSGTDTVGRILTEKLSERMKQSFVVDNREGAGGSVGVAAAARSPNDGYTLLFGVPTMTVSPHMQAQPLFDPVKDFIPIVKVAEQPLMLVTANTSPYKNLKELVAHARANPGKLTYATSGKGSPSHLGIELIRQATKIDVRDVPYKNTGQAMTDTIAGHVSFYFPGVSAALPNVKGGKLRPLAIGAARRYADAPDVPTVTEELGVSGLNVLTWYGFFAPAGTPREIVTRLAAEVTRIMELPDVKERIAKAGASVTVAGPEAFAAEVSADSTKYGKLVKELGLKE